MGVPNLKNLSTYSQFDQLDGRHPIQKIVPESCVLYSVRMLAGGRVAYFNWALAKEMGLIAPHHSEQMNSQLEQKLLETFCIRIINEWDQKQQIHYPKTSIKPYQYMATRYLQLQHPDKTGRTSGDGRGIWNGVIRNQGKIWDVSSRGTGVTSLAPGAVQAGKPLKSGNRDHGYGCGLAEIDELYAAAIMAEVIHQQGIETERVLTIIDLGKGIGIGVRAGQNLLRPAHLFAPLKQNDLDRLQRTTDYVIARQIQNQKWDLSIQNKKKYEIMGIELAKSFAHFAAQLEREYIFAWLDWDGDNVLFSAGIIDYGSIRQFGLRHDQYRYDDVQRFSTNLNEQKLKARQMVQTFAQLIDFISSKKRRPIDDFKSSNYVKEFDRQFDESIHKHFLYQVGFSESQTQKLMSQHVSLIKKLYAEFLFFERKKTYKKMSRVSDGINRPAIFNMRSLLHGLPDLFLDENYNSERGLVSTEEFFGLMLSEYAKGPDKRLNSRIKNRILRFQKLYKKAILEVSQKRSWNWTLKQIKTRAQKINRSDRITGNALIHVVDEIIKARKRGLSDLAVQAVVDAIVSEQNIKSRSQNVGEQLPSSTHKLFRQILTLVEDHREEI